MKKTLEKVVKKLSQRKILVIGDLILDEYIYGKANRISPEAPVPVVWAQSREYLPGGASNVAHNICSLGGQVSIVGLVGKDDRAQILLSELNRHHINTSGVFGVYNRATSIKTRIVAGQQQIVRLDWENIEAVRQTVEEKVKDFLKRSIKKFDAVILEDYGKGLITPEIAACAVTQARLHNTCITVDPKEEHFEYYRGVTAITPNLKEAENAIRNIRIRNSDPALPVFSDRLQTSDDVDVAGKALLEYLDLDALLLTLGEEGMRLFEQRKKPHHIDTLAQEVFDVSGAGDTVVAAFTLALASGASMVEAAEFANVAAGIVVGRRGVAVVTPQEIVERLKKPYRRIIRSR